MRTIPSELEEAARIDGLGVVRDLVVRSSSRS